MDQSTLLLIGLCIFIVAGWYVLGRRPKTNVKLDKDKAVYHYERREGVMTPAEVDFYHRLEAVIDGRYYLFPQVHLSSILDHRIKGNGYVNWKAAFRHINGKSVDYVMCDKVTLEPIVAIELDDVTHSREDRKLRDDEVERIFSEAHLPLVRFANSSNLTASAIEDQLRAAVANQPL